ncbi:hypothetical protein OSJ16_12785 [Mycobacterium ulcerans]
MSPAVMARAALAVTERWAVPAVPVVTVWRELRVRMPPLSADPAAMAVLAAVVVPAGTAAMAARPGDRLRWFGRRRWAGPAAWEHRRHRRGRR